MTAPMTGNDAIYAAPASKAGGKRRRKRAPREPSLFLSRLRRAARRQALLFIVAALMIGACGVLYEMAGGALLIVFILFMGLWPSPFVDRISPTVVNFLPGVG